MLLIERGVQQEIRNTGRTKLKTVNIVDRGNTIENFRWEPQGESREWCGKMVQRRPAQASDLEHNGVVSALYSSYFALRSADSRSSGARGRAFESRRAHVITRIPGVTCWRAGISFFWWLRNDADSHALLIPARSSLDAALLLRS